MRIIRQYISFYIIALLMMFGGNTYARNYNNVVDNISIEIEKLFPSMKYSYSIINSSILIINLAEYENIAANLSNKKMIAYNIAKIAKKHLHDSTVEKVGVVYRVQKTFLYFLSYDYSDVTFFFKVK